MRSLRLAVISALGVCAWGLCFPAAHAHTRITTDVSWSGQIRELLREKCMTCHHPGGIAPDYADFTFYGTDTEPGAWAWRAAIEEEVITGRMPPWQPDKRFGHFSNAKRLTPYEIDLLIAWSRGGGPQGPQRDLPVPEEFLTRDWEFGQPDLVFSLEDEPYTLRAEEQYGSHTATFPIEIEEDTWVTAYEFFPGNPKNIYRMTAILHDPENFEPKPIEVELEVEYDPLASEEELEQTRMRDMPKGPHFLGQWVRGDEPVLLPPDGGRMLRAGSTVELRIEYERPMFADWSKDVVDQSKFGLFIAKPEEEIDILVESIRVAADEDVVIPAGDANAQVSVSYTTEENVHLTGIHPDLGLLAKNLMVTATYPDGLTQTVMWMPEFKHRWNSSYHFAEPIAAPKGTVIELVAHYDNSEDNWDNPNSPPKDVKFGPGVTDERLTAWIDYTLDDHLIVQREFEPPPDSERDRGGMTIFTNIFEPGQDEEAEQTQVAGLPIDPKFDPTLLQPGLSPEDENIYWCPMRGDFCGVDDYVGPGTCKDCGMDLRPKATFFEGMDTAPESAEWAMTEVGALPVYWCPNRGRDDHSLVDYSQPGRCSVCGEPLAHKAQFETQHTWTCLTTTCDKRGSLFYGPGLCPECGQPVSGMGHMDHTPRHGGQFFMADNLYHHLEGTMPEPGLFKVYFYDDWRNPLDGRNFAGRVIVEEEDEATGKVTEIEYPLELDKEGDPFLIAKLPETFPQVFYVMAWLAGEEKRFDFEFTEVTKDTEKKIDTAAIRLHSHEREPVTIPATVEGIVRAMLQRDNAVQELIKAADWFGLHYPAFDAKDFVAALADRQEGLDVRQRGELKKAIGLINRGANDLDRAGDVGDAARVERAYDTFAEGMTIIKGLWPNVTP